MNQDKQSEVIERVVAILKRRMFINDLGAADGGPEEFRMQGHERAAREIVTALSRPSPSTPSAGPYEFPYQATFNAIAAATWISGDMISISVKDFQEAFNASGVAISTPSEGVIEATYIASFLEEFARRLPGVDVGSAISCAKARFGNAPGDPVEDAEAEADEWRRAL